MPDFLVPILSWGGAPAGAQESDPLDTVPELVGLRLRHDIPVTLRPGPCGDGRADQTVVVASSDVPVLRWSGPDARWSIPYDDLAGDGKNGEAVLPPDLSFGVHRVCLESGELSTKVDLRVEPPPYTQITIAEIGPDGFQRLRGISHQVMNGSKPVPTLGWRTSDFVRTDRVLDEQGRELQLYRQHDYDDHVFLYEAVLAEPAPAGSLVVLEGHGTGEPLPLTESNAGEMTYEFRHSPNAPTVTRRVEIFRLPPGAVVLEADDFTERIRDDRVELVKVTSIPTGESTHTLFRYRAEGIWLGLPGPRVVTTVPASGATDVDASSTREIRVTFDADMRPGSWSWVQVSDGTYPKTRGDPVYVDDRTCVLPVKLKPDTDYVVWINSPRFDNFRGVDGRSAKPYEVRFRTADR